MKDKAPIHQRIADQFMQKMKERGLKQSTQEKYKEHFRRFHKQIKGQTHVTNQNIKEYITQGKRYNTLSRAFAKLYAKSADIELDLEKQTGSTERRQVKKPFPEEYFQALIKRIEHPTLNLLLRLGRMTGMRKGELLELSDADVDKMEPIINIKNAKGNKQRTVFINETMHNELMQYFAHKPLGHTFGKEFKYPEQVNFMIHKQLVALGLDKTGPHVICRHSFASNLRKKGMPLEDIKDLLGHESINTTMIYAHLDTAKLREKLEKIGGLDNE